MRLIKGHATGNDFVIIDDRDDEFELTDSFVRAVCDRHRGIGADGVLRLVRSAAHPEGAAMAAEAPFFMDYRNADGSVAEMCGNGIRLFMRYLQAEGLAGPQTAIATRGGVRRVWVQGEEITVEMGRATVLTAAPTVRTRGAARVRPGIAVQVPNPHVVVGLATEAELDELDLTEPPAVEPGMPEGQNVEFVVTLGPRHLAMRVHERGVGETLSCGTGICAAVVAQAARLGGADRDATLWQVDVGGGRCQVCWRLDGELLLTGPAVLVAEVALRDEWLSGLN